MPLTSRVRRHDPDQDDPPAPAHGRVMKRAEVAGHADGEVEPPAPAHRRVMKRAEVAGHADGEVDTRALDHGRPIERGEVVRIGLVALAVLAGWLMPWTLMGDSEPIMLAAALVGGYPIWKRGLAAVRRRRVTLELSIAIATAAALLIGASAIASLIVLFSLVAGVVERIALGRGRRAVEEMGELLPRTAVVRFGPDELVVDVAHLRIGDVVVVNPGERLPVDGEVIAGHSFVDQAIITGDSRPAEMLPGSRVQAGTLNRTGTMQVQATSVGQATAFAGILGAAQRAEKASAPIERSGDRLARCVVYAALACAAATLVVTGDELATVAVINGAAACGVAVRIGSVVIAYRSSAPLGALPLSTESAAL